MYVVLLFVALEAVAVGYYARSSSYTQARLLSRSNEVIGGVHGFFAGVRHYFLLGDENERLLARVAELEEQVAEYREAIVRAQLDSCLTGPESAQYRLMTARVVAATVNRSQNLITLNKGLRDGVVDQMAVLAPDGAMVGYVIDCSDRYSVVLPVLNTAFRASGKLAGGEYFGSIYWDGLNPGEVTLGELSKYADPRPGDEVVSAGFSQYFPPDVLIGWVERAELDETRTSYTVTVRLAAEMTALGNVVLVENRDLREATELGESEKVRQHLQRN